jgi:hypothetical protein
MKLRGQYGPYASAIEIAVHAGQVEQAVTRERRN